MTLRIIILLLVITLVSFLCWRFSYNIENGDDILNIVYLLLVLSLIIGGSQFDFKGKQIKSLISNTIYWLVIIFIIIIAYSYKDILLSNRIISAILPSVPIERKDGSLVLAAREDGHFYTEVTINNKKIICVIDTGASSVVIDGRQANYIGINIDNLNFNRQTYTANGIGRAAMVKVPSFAIGNIIMQDMEILINSQQMSSCLLGMSFLSKLSGFTFEANRLLLLP